MTHRKCSKLVGFVAVAATAFAPRTFGADEPPTTAGTLAEVTVYRGQALVTRVVDLAPTGGGKSAPGLREIVVTNLPEQIIPSSLYAEGGEGIEVRSVRYRQRPVAEDVREEVRKLDARVREVQDELEAVKRQSFVINQHENFLRKLDAFVAPTAEVELSKGVLNADTLKTLAAFLYTEWTRMGAEGVANARQARALQEQLDLLLRERNELTGSSTRIVKEAVVSLQVNSDHPEPLRLRYLVNEATWGPHYSLLTDPAYKDVQIEYNALVQQMSGEDWNNVRMTLSTATPALVAKAPVLMPLKLTLTREPEQSVQVFNKAGVSAGDYSGAKGNLQQQLRSIEASRNVEGVQQMGGQWGQSIPASPASDGESKYGDKQPPGYSSLDVDLNIAANYIQILDLVTREKIKRPAKAPAARDEGLSVTYGLPGRISLPSRSDRQLIQIATLPMVAQTYKVATPALTNYVYNEAWLTNQTELVLLAGSASAFVGGQFVGHGTVPTVAVGQSFTVGLGIDPALRADRELVQRDETAQGGNRVATLTYRLTVENYGTGPAAVRLLDALPTARESEIKITLVSGDKDLCQDSAYLETGRKQGILRWDVTVPPQVSGHNAFALEYEYRLEYDKQMSLDESGSRE
ncbi:MAG TPA: mucoidy inhibitor MuiA family protein [Phycisphaerae bacterium]|nr:mucoidy inhibitor MuiA family protein [Phycisphaerae bacterium]HNU44893.1 mucoidy inhibitor MuiA family protein [Phycisphaerae bacterium]